MRFSSLMVTMDRSSLYLSMILSEQVFTRPDQP
jgi:hypothetical protein